MANPANVFARSQNSGEIHIHKANTCQHGFKTRRDLTFNNLSNDLTLTRFDINYILIVQYYTTVV